MDTTRVTREHFCYIFNPGHVQDAWMSVWSSLRKPGHSQWGKESQLLNSKCQTIHYDIVFLGHSSPLQ